MTEATINALYDYGKKVYEGEIDLATAIKEVANAYDDVAESSARHYINWYAKMREGEYLT